jgi:hypothetical protein
VSHAAASGSEHLTYRWSRADLRCSHNVGLVLTRAILPEPKGMSLEQLAAVATPGSPDRMGGGSKSMQRIVVGVDGLDLGDAALLRALEEAENAGPRIPGARRVAVLRLGSVSQVWLAHATCPVMIVRPKKGLRPPHRPVSTNRGIDEAQRQTRIVSVGRPCPLQDPGEGGFSVVQRDGRATPAPASWRGTLLAGVVVAPPWADRAPSSVSKQSSHRRPKSRPAPIRT